MSNVSAQVIQSMFNHLTASYSADEAREILAQKYPEASADIQTLAVDPSKYGVTTVEMGKKVSVTEAGATEATPVKEKAKKVAKPKAEKVEKAKTESKADKARELYASAKDKSRAAMIALFQEKLGMSKAAASTYFYNVKG